MRLLVYVPRSRYRPASITSIERLAYRGDYSVWHDWEGNRLDANRYDVITAKAERARQLALSQDYDAMVIIEDDQVVPGYNTLRTLTDWARAYDVVYGLSVWRHDPTVWTAAISIDEHKIEMLTKVAPALREQHWGRVVELPGVHMGCTLMTRRALEAVTFERRGPNCYDYYAAVDWQTQGIRQVTDFGLHVGHITKDGIAYPSLDPGNHRLVKENA
ncbi:MAG: hypothetical protein IH587_09720 [Anaerolineae bacterium]|nr:hypothetical protein [Anaerolineae bacterium]